MSFIKILFVFLVINSTLFDVGNGYTNTILDYVDRKIQIMKEKLLNDISNVDIMYCSIDEDGEKRMKKHVYFPSKLSDIADSMEFRLFTKLNKNRYVLLNKDGKPTDGSPHTEIMNLLVGTKSLKIITHGWTKTADSPSVANLKEAYLETREDVIVIAVDWSKFADTEDYKKAAYMTKDVGLALAKFIESLDTRYNIGGLGIHLIGHSLGAHVVGNAGTGTFIPIGRVTGLDPALPLFNDVYPRLTRDSAAFVDVIHTCGGTMAFQIPIGHADFYPNGGVHPQPGCDFMLPYSGHTSRFSHSARCSIVIPPGWTCSHHRAHEYFEESIRHPHIYKSYPCPSWSDFIHKLCPTATTFMGEDGDIAARGTYFLRTRAPEDNPLLGSRAGSYWQWHY